MNVRLVIEMSRLTIGIERGPENVVSEEQILLFFQERGLTYNDDYISIGDARFEYFIVEKANYITFKENNSVGLFTDAVIEFVRTLSDEDQVVVKEQIEGSSINSDGDIIYTGDADSFIGFWDTMGDE